MAAKADRNLILAAYRKSGRRIFFLDYDGTLVPFSARPEYSSLNEEIRMLLSGLSNDPSNRIYIISGRDRNFLDQQFRDFRVGLIAEHGYLVKEPGENWVPQTLIDNGWTSEVRKVLHRFTEQIRGSFIEEKEASIAYHYRTAENLSGKKTPSFLLKELNLIRQHHPGLELMTGHKVVEIKPAEYDKGSTARRILSRGNQDFILAAGDDFSDEQLFAKMPKDALTIKIGRSKTAAACYFPTRDRFIELLWEIAEAK